MERATVRIPKPLADTADALVARGFNGFTSRADVVSHALRAYYERVPAEASIGS